jgi:predicted transcriptional regulator
MNEDLSQEEVHQALDWAVEELLTAAQVTAPPVDALRIARNYLGMTVSLASDSPPRRRPQSAVSGKPILLHAEESEERQQWAVAQAIGTHCKPDLLRWLGVAPDQARALAGASLVNLFAGRLLVPTAWFAADARATGYDLLELKSRYRTAAHETLADRLLDLPESSIITVVDDARVLRRRSNAWRVRRELEPAERACQQYVSTHSRPHVIRADGWTVQGWPIPQSDSQRVILRSVVEE